MEQGGVIFWLDTTKQHRLACSSNDLNNGVTNATGDGIYAGGNNMTIIISALLTIGDNGLPFAAQLCNELIVNQGVEYGDWYLPSRSELEELSNNRVIVNQTALADEGDWLNNDFYWTSTEDAFDGVWSYNPATNYEVSYTINSVHYVQAIRTF